MCSIDDVIRVLNEAPLREALITKLKNAQNTQSISNTLLQNLKLFIDESEILKASKVIHQTSMIQNFCKFIQPHEALQNFQFVSKSWKHAIDTIRFDFIDCKISKLVPKTVYDADRILKSDIFPNPKLLGNIIEKLQCIEFDDEDSSLLLPLVTERSKNFCSLLSWYPFYMAFHYCT